MDTTTEGRLIDLETRYTHLERQFEELSSVVARQQNVFDGMVKSLGRALERLAALGSAGPDEPPPHY
jgi:uncharacterized coiled-coil protein SlyX